MRVSETSTVGSAENRWGTLIAKKALKVAEQFEQVGQRKLAPRTVRETLAELYREIYSETLPVATVRKFIADWLRTKQPEVSPGTLVFYKNSTAKDLEVLRPAADLDIASIAPDNHGTSRPCRRAFAEPLLKFG